MGIINRDKHISEQVDNYDMNFGNGVVGISTLVYSFVAPTAYQVLGYQLIAAGVSGTPVVNVQIQRFVTGAGLTTITGGFTALSVGTAWGTSGALAFISGLTQGSTLTQLQSGDVLQFVTSGANSAATYCGQVMCKVLSDYKTFFGQSIANP